MLILIIARRRTAMVFDEALCCFNILLPFKISLTAPVKLKFMLFLEVIPEENGSFELL